MKDNTQQAWEKMKVAKRELDRLRMIAHALGVDVDGWSLMDIPAYRSWMVKISEDPELASDNK